MAESNEVTRVAFAEPIEVNVNIPNFEGKAGRDGVDGRDGDDAYRVAVRNGFVGTEQEWLASLQGGGTGASKAEKARQKLLENNVWCDDSTVDSVLSAVIGNWGKPMPRTDYKPMRLESSLIVGMKNFSFSGEPHYKLQVDSNEPQEFDENGVLNIELTNTNAGDSFSVQYLNYTGGYVSGNSYNFGDLTAVFRTGSLIESKAFNIPDFQTNVLVSVYDNKIVSITRNSDADDESSHTISDSGYREIFDWVKTKVDDVETIIFDRSVTLWQWVAEYISWIEKIYNILGHGFNLKIDLTNYSYRDENRGEKLIEARTSDRYGKILINKAIQVGDSNIFIVKPTGKRIMFDYKTHLIKESN